MANTVPLRRGITKGLEKNFDFDRLTLSRNLMFTGRNDEYEILSEEYLDMGGESVIYLARRVSDGVKVVAKIYDRFEDNQSNRSKRKKVINFITKHSDYSVTHLMPILDHGILTVPSMSDEDDYDFQYPLDILPYCEEGKIMKAGYEELRSKIIPDVLHALNLMHSENFVHRDLKPANLYRYGREIVIGDIGTVSEIKAVNFHGTQRKRGTPGYTAPEVWQGYAVMASDYFSFGCTIASLYKGEHVYQSLMDLNDESAIQFTMKKDGLPLGCPEKESDLQALVDSLTHFDESLRGGYEEVMLWLQDGKKFIKEHHIRNSIKREERFEFHFEKQILRNEQEMVMALSTQWETAKDYLYRGGVQNSALMTFFSRINQALGVKIGKIIEERKTATNYDLGMARLLHILKEDGPLYWRGKSYERLSDLAEEISSDRSTHAQIASMLESRYISWKLERVPQVDEKLLISVKKIEDLAERYLDMAVFLFRYQFALQETKKSYKGAKTPDDVFLRLANTPGGFYTNIKALYSDNELLAYLCYLGFYDQILYVRPKLTGKLREDMELIYRLFEVMVKDKSMIRGHYCRFGQHGHLYWLHQNLSLYSFRTPEALRVKSCIEKVKIEFTSSIDEISRGFTQLKQYENDFRDLFRTDILLVYLGMESDNEGSAITSDYSDAYFVNEFYDNIVTAGFLREFSQGKAYEGR